MWANLNVNSAMGLQATAATKRKHEITFDGKEANTYTNCPSPPIKVCKWSKNSSLIEAFEEKMLQSKSIANNSNNNNSLGKIKSFGDFNGVRRSSTATSSVVLNSSEVTKTLTGITTIASSAEIVCSATTPLPPSASTPILEDSIAKLEEVAAAHCEPWHGALAEPIDCISKLQAVAVPSDPWGSIATRSTLATTLLSADEIDDDDDDFEDDYEEEEGIIPTYCPLRYHPFAATPTSALQQQQHQQRSNSYTPTASASHGGPYSSSGTRPNYYSEPFPQQNCSRTGSSHHLRMSGGSGVPAAFPQWSSGSSQQFYVPHETEYPPPQQQQTIRCAENGKSYLDLGCSTPAPPPPLPVLNVVASAATATTAASAATYSSMHAVTGSPLKRCCEGRAAWCNTTKHCYKDIRMKIRNLSMFKLSRFRQVSEQSLYRSVLICNTLKYIDREIETEAKELHQAAHAAHTAHQQQQHHHTQYQHLHHPHHLQHHHMHHHNLLQHSSQHSSVQQMQQSQASTLPLPLPPLAQQLHQEYAPPLPVLSCARVSSLDYQSLQQLQSLPPTQHYQQHQSPLYNSGVHGAAERLTPTSQTYLSTQEQKNTVPAAPVAFAGSSNNCDSASPTLASLHPYDHCPFRESQSGRATPFPSQALSNAATAISPQEQQQQTTPTSSTSASSASALTSSASSANADLDSSCYADDDTRSINWSSVLSLSSQSALDPLNNNELFSIISGTPATTIPPATANAPSTADESTEANMPSSVSCSSTTQSSLSAMSGSGGCYTTVPTVASSSSTVDTQSVEHSGGTNEQNADSGSLIACATNALTSTTATFTTLSTISSATYSMTSAAYGVSLSQQASAAATSAAGSGWEYSFLDMDFGLGSEFTELMPSCKLSSDDLFKNALTPVATSRYSSVHDNELEQPVHIMVGS